MPEAAVPRPLPGERSRLLRIGVMLLNGYGYNWYRRDNQMLADDLLVRSRASEHLEHAANRLRDRETLYRKEHLPPPTRAQPDVDPAHLAAARRLRGLGERIGALDTGLRGAAVPPDDKIWRRHRDELDTLRRLGECDAVLLAGAKELDDYVAALPAEGGLDAAAEREIAHRLDAFGAGLAERAALVAIAP